MEISSRTLMVVFKMRDSVPSARYSSVCNVLRQWNISLIPTYSLPTLLSTDSMIIIILSSVDLAR